MGQQFGKGTVRMSSSEILAGSDLVTGDWNLLGVCLLPYLPVGDVCQLGPQLGDQHVGS